MQRRDDYLFEIRVGHVSAEMFKFGNLPDTRDRALKMAADLHGLNSQRYSVELRNQGETGAEIWLVRLPFGHWEPQVH